VLPQAIHLARTAPRFSRAAGPRQGSVGSGRNLDLVAIGDSIIAGVGAASLSRALVGQAAIHLSRVLQCQISWSAHGMIGADTRKVIDRLVPQLPTRGIDFMVVSVGVNDVTSLARTSTWRRRLSDLLALLSDHSPHAIIAVMGIPPLKGFPLLPRPLRDLFGMRAEVFDEIARDVIHRHRHVVHVPLDFEPKPEMFAADGYHPSPASYQELGEMVARVLAESFDTMQPGMMKWRTYLT
jgi:lysophospholipase L1-like esterase